MLMMKEENSTVIEEDITLEEEDMLKELEEDFDEDSILKNIKSSDTMMRDNVRQYLREIGRYPLLSAEEEQVIGKAIKEGDQKAKQTLIESNLRLVVSIAKSMPVRRAVLISHLKARTSTSGTIGEKSAIRGTFFVSFVTFGFLAAQQNTFPFTFIPMIISAMAMITPGIKSISATLCTISCDTCDTPSMVKSPWMKFQRVTLKK